MSKSVIEWNRMMSGKLYSPYKVGDDSWDRVHAAQKRFNESEFWRDQSALEELKKCFGKAADDMFLVPPVYFDHGDRVFFGEHFFANTDLTILDEREVIFGDNVFLAPHVSIYTACHPIDAVVRNTGLEYAKPVKIGSDVWIGGNVVINPGVTIGDDVVIGSGSVVTKDIPAHVIAVGNPCRVLREITEEDREFWKRQYQDYLNESNYRQETRYTMAIHKFYGWEQADVPAITDEYANIHSPADLYDALSDIWCEYTCAPRMRQEWSRENMTLGQCSITAFLAQDIFGGKVYGILRPDGNYHCYNVVGDCVFDLTSEQFGDEKLDYENNPEQFREVHFAKTEKRERYEYLKEQLGRR